VYLILIRLVLALTQKNVTTIAEDVSAFPGITLKIQEGGIGFDYRLNMAIPDFWINLLKNVKDEDWDIYKMVYSYKNVRQHEKVISYCESHDQSIVGDKTIAQWLFDNEIYFGMSKSQPNTPRRFRGIALHKMIRFLTMILGDGYLCFIGNEFGHPEWIDFPRDGNNWSHHYCRRQWSLADNEMLVFRDLQTFDQDMIRLETEFQIQRQWQQMYIDFIPEIKVVTFEGDAFIIVFNFNPSEVP
jgi:1,4-alpha-glucan branching enzyme